eukprot:4660192-Pyramimonas_sp.AAC.1
MLTCRPRAAAHKQAIKKRERGPRRGQAGTEEDERRQTERQDNIDNVQDCHLRRPCSQIGMRGSPARAFA